MIVNRAIGGARGPSASSDPAAGWLEVAGVLIQWGSYTCLGSESTVDITYERSFSSLPVVTSGSSWNGNHWYATNPTTTGFHVGTSGSYAAGYKIDWLAIGPA